VTDPDADLDGLRAEVAAAHGLDADAAGFLTGSTVEEVEESAVALVKLLGERGQAEDVGADLFTRAAAQKARRKETLLAALSGPAPQPRDAGGRYASFDGGARTPAPSPESHGDWLGRVVRSRVADVGRRL
jgi:hypothetical protein